MALGLPVIASDLPGTRGMLSSDCLFAVGDLAQACRLLCGVADTAQRAAIVQRNRDVFIARASAAAFSGGVAQLTEQLCALTASGATAEGTTASFSEASPKAEFP
jgi:hypothetical protein